MGVVTKYKQQRLQPTKETTMPNHIDNNVLIVASNELVKKIRNEIRSDEIDGDMGTPCPIDFDKIIPMPKAAKIIKFINVLDKKAFC